MRAKTWAQNMFKLCLDSEGRIDAARLSAMCEYASKNFAGGEAVEILRVFKRLVGARIARDSALVESAGPLDEEARRGIEAFVKSKNPRVLAEFKENPELLAGVRVRIGDCIWENSARQKLRDFAKSLGA